MNVADPIFDAFCAPVHEVMDEALADARGNDDDRQPRLELVAASTAPRESGGPMYSEGEVRRALER